MTKRDYVALAAALMETRPFISETQYHRMKRNKDAPAYFLILQWENCAHALCRALHRDNPRFSPDQFLQAAGFVTTPRARIH